jgi:hypothetical protein
MILFKGSIFIVICLTFNQPLRAGKLLFNDTIKKNDTGFAVNNDASPSEKMNKIKPRKYKRGDTLYFCEVLKLSSHNYREHYFAVFGFAHIIARKSRSKMKINYVLKRERNYLSNIFYSKAVVLEKKRVDTKVSAHMKKLEKRYPLIRMWGVLDANAIYQFQIVGS